MIRNFRRKGLERYYRMGSVAGIHPAHARKLGDILTALDQAGQPEDANFAGFRLHPLKGTRKGQWSVTVAANWRVTFSFDKNGDVIDVNDEDYH
jgi:proteic killer suppression protein